MSIFKEPVLKSEVVEVRGQSVTLYELTALARCNYLERMASDAVVDDEAEGGEEAEKRTLKQLWANIGELTKERLWLVAYALVQGVDDDVESIYAELAESVPKDEALILWKAAATLSSFPVPDGSDAPEGKSEPSPADSSPDS